MNDVILTIEQAADFLQLSRDTLYRYAQSGKVPASRIGKHWRFSQATLGAWVRASGAAEAGDLPAEIPGEGEEQPPAMASASAAPPSAASPVDGMEVLIVDDDVAIGKLIGTWVQRMGNRPTVAVSGRKAIELLAQGSFDLVFLDLFLGDMTADKVLSHIPRECPPPVVMMSGMPGSSAMDAALDFPVAYALAKPFTREEVERVVRMLAVDPGRMAG